MENIKVSMDTYHQFVNRYEELHEKICTDIEYCKNAMLDLTQGSGAFYADETSGKIKETILNWNSEDIPYLLKGFEQMESSVKEYIKAMESADKI